jgi:hypothetical protein
LLYFVKILDGLDFLVSLLPVFGFPSARETLLLLVGQARKTPIDCPWTCGWHDGKLPDARSHP